MLIWIQIQVSECQQLVLYGKTVVDNGALVC